MTVSASLSLALAILAPAQNSATVLPPCCETVQATVYEHPKPAYPKDIRQYTYVTKTVEKVVCKMQSSASCCAPATKPGE